MSPVLDVALGTVVTPAAGLMKLTCQSGLPSPRLVGVEGVDAVVLGGHEDHVCVPAPGIERLDI